MATSEIEALTVERDAYLARGRKDRAAECDASLAALGVKVDPPVEAAVPARGDVETAVPASPRPRGRKANG